jgi:hypothetical protein
MMIMPHLRVDCNVPVQQQPLLQMYTATPAELLLELVLLLLEGPLQLLLLLVVEHLLQLSMCRLASVSFLAVCQAS